MATTPATAPKGPTTDKGGADADGRRKQYLRRLAGMRTERSTWAAHWQDIGDNLLPRRLQFDNTTSKKGVKQNTQIVDMTANLALRTLKSGMMAGLTSPARPWFRLAPTDDSLAENAAVKRWLFEVETILRNVFARSNLYSALPVHYGDIGGFGTAATLILDDADTVVRFYPLPLGSFCIATNARQQIDTLFREVKMTVRQIVTEFLMDPKTGDIDWSRSSTGLKESWTKKEFDRWLDVVQVIEPNDTYQPERLGPVGKRWRSCWFELAADERHDQFLREDGYEEFPVLCSRWDVMGQDVYGTCPGMDVLPDTKQLQLMQRRKLQALDKLVNPPMRGPTSLQTKRTSLLPGDTTYVDGTAATGTFEPAYVIRPELNHFTLEIQDVQQRISRALYEDLFLMLTLSDRREITAREIEERHEEKLLMLGPVLERQNGELLDPLIDRTFAILERRGMLPEPPEELQGAELKVEYVSMLAAAQRAVGTGSLERLAGFALQFAEVDPSVLAKLDSHQLIDEYGTMLGVPPSVIRSDEGAQAITEQQQKQQQALAAAQAAPLAAKAAKDASETQMGGDTALSRMTGESAGPRAAERAA